MSIIIAPNRDYTGAVAGVVFVNGIGETTDRTALEYFTRHGFGIHANLAAAGLPASYALSVTVAVKSASVENLQQFAGQKSVDVTGLTEASGLRDALSVPGTPAAPVGTGGSTQVSWAWTAPTWAGFTAIDKYEVQTYTAADAVVGAAIEDTATPTVKTGLTAATPYKAKIRAHNTAGWGPWSAFSAEATTS